MQIFDEYGKEITTFSFTAGSSSVNRRFTVRFRSESATAIYVKLNCVNASSGDLPLAAYMLSKAEENTDDITLSLSSVSDTVNLSDAKNAEWAHHGYHDAVSVNRNNSELPMVLGSVNQIIVNTLQRGDDYSRS